MKRLESIMRGRENFNLICILFMKAIKASHTHTRSQAVSGKLEGINVEWKSLSWAFIWDSCTVKNFVYVKGERKKVWDGSVRLVTSDRVMFNVMRRGSFQFSFRKFITNFHVTNFIPPKVLYVCGYFRKIECFLARFVYVIMIINKKVNMRRNFYEIFSYLLECVEHEINLSMW